MSRLALYRDRIAYVGMTQSGKSELARAHFEAANCRRMLVDPKHSWHIPDVEITARVEAIDWTAPVIHVRPPWLDRDFSDRLYGEAFRRLRHALIWTDEAYGVCTPQWGNGIVAIQTQGAELEIGHQVCSQRPVNARRELWTEAGHLFLFGELDEEDLRTVAQGFSFVSFAELRKQWAELERHACLWLDKRERRITLVDPLPEELRRPRLVFRRSERAT